MSHDDAIQGGIKRLRARAAIVGFARYGLKALFYLLLVGAALLLVLPASEMGGPLLVIGALVALAASFGFALGLLRRPAPATAAKLFDDVAGLKDRVSSSVELRDAEGPMVRALREDAARDVAGIEPAAVFRFALPREGWLMPVPVGALALVLILPGLIGAKPVTEPVLEGRLDDAVAQLDALMSKENERTPTPASRELALQLEEITAQLSRRPIDKRDALAEVSKMMESLADDREELETEKMELEKLVKSVQANERTQELAEEVQQGAYSEAANRVAEMVEELKRDLKEKRKLNVAPEELEELEEELRELEELQAKLMKLLNVQYDIDARAKVVEFLDTLEGELGDIPDDKIVDAKFVKFGQCQGQCNAKDIVRLPQMLLPPNSKAGKATMDYFGNETENDAVTEEHKVTVRETSGSSAFTQTQVANDGSRSQLAEAEVLAAEQRAAEETIQRQDVPAGYRDYIRRYFDEIQPDAPPAEADDEGR